MLIGAIKEIIIETNRILLRLKIGHQITFIVPAIEGFLGWAAVLEIVSMKMGSK